MKTIILVLASVLCFTGLAKAEETAYLLRLTDGTSVVWDTYYVKDSRYCTMKSVGEVCWSKSDVKKITKVAPGTDASEYGLSSGIADESAAARKKGNSAALDSSSASDKQTLREKQKRDLAEQYDRTLNKNKKFGEQ